MIPAVVASIFAAATALGMGWMAVDVAAAESEDRMRLAQAQMEDSAAATEFTDQQIERFAAAHRQVVMLQQQYAGPDQEDILRERAAETITAQGLTIPEYNQIYLAAQRDEQLRDQVAQEVEAME